MRKILLIMAAVIFGHGSILADDNAQRLAQDNSAFASNLYHQLSDSEGNLFFSPYSISTALAMTESGARGETESQMAKALHFSLPRDKLDPAFAELRTDLNAAQGDGKVTLAIANSIWPSTRYKFLDSYIGILKNNYGVSVTPLDYTKTEAANHHQQVGREQNARQDHGPHRTRSPQARYEVDTGECDLFLRKMAESLSAERHG